MAKKIDLTGLKFGRLSVIRQVPRPEGFSNTRARWLCHCECGKKTEVDSGNLRLGLVVSCGCAKSDANVAAHTTHGDSRGGRRSPEYRSYQAMLTRCTNPNQRGWKYYGGRGITVCQRWLESFENFLADMGRKPSSGLTIERKKNDLVYSPENCKWATVAEQNANKRPQTKPAHNIPPKSCVVCGTSIPYVPKMNHSKRKFCSLRCVGIHHKGMPMAERKSL